MADDGRCLLCQRTRPVTEAEPRSPWPLIGFVAVVFLIALGGYALKRQADRTAAAPDTLVLPVAGEPASDGPNQVVKAPAPVVKEQASIEDRRREVREEREEREALLEDEMHRVPITMYTTPTCVNCKQAREWFTENKYTFSERDTESDERWASRLAELNPRKSVPTLEIDGTVVVVGFSPRKVESALRRAAALRLE